MHSILSVNALHWPIVFVFVKLQAVQQIVSVNWLHCQIDYSIFISISIFVFAFVFVSIFVTLRAVHDIVSVNELHCQIVFVFVFVSVT